MIRLVPMNEIDYQAYADFSIADYAQEHVKAGSWSTAEALQEAKKQYQELLPDGLKTKNHYIYSIVDDELASKVGILWFAVQERAQVPAAFVYDVLIYEAFRRRGYGEQAFKALETKVQELGLKTISLHVFGHNHPGRAM
jgi:GNAT superfamily N-acetyltransferase